jgi:hypothetical protein
MSPPAAATATPSSPEAAPAFDPKLVLDTARAPLAPGQPEKLRFQIHGEHQIRLTRLTDLKLLRMDGSFDILGQTTRIYHWLRLTPRLQFGDRLELVGQADAPKGFALGQTTQGVRAARHPYDRRRPYEIEPRWLYLQWLSPAGVWRIGQRPAHWGMGILTNDGDHPPLFGDYLGGAKVDGLLWALWPAETAGINLSLAADLVFEDSQARLLDHDQALQGVVTVSYRDPSHNEIGFYARYRHQTTDTAGLSSGSSERPVDSLSLDATGQFHTELPGGGGHIFGASELVYVWGKSGAGPSLGARRADQSATVRQFGAAARLGVVFTSGTGEERWGFLVTSVDWGWASGDANPYNNMLRSFRFDENYKIGLILFNQVLAWKTARAATIMEDFLGRRLSGADGVVSNGAIFGASYFNPTVVLRPRPELDLKFGALIAQTSSDFVDPWQSLVGSVRNYDGGDPRAHDLGLELDAGAEYRMVLPHGPTLQFGAEGGVFFPGNAFADRSGSRLATQLLAMLRAGVQF